jgi:hypothetical protein
LVVKGIHPSKNKNAVSTFKIASRHPIPYLGHAKAQRIHYQRLCLE